MKTIKRICQSNGRSDGSAKVDNRTSQDEHDPMGGIIRSETHHQESDYHPDKRGEEEVKFVFCFGDTVMFLRHADRDVVCQSTSEYRSGV